MLVVNKNLNAKDVSGKKYRSSAFTFSAFFSIPFVLLVILACSAVPNRDDRGVIIALIVVVLLALPCAMQVCFRKISYVLGEERLYFFDAQIKRPKNENRKKASCVRSNGSVEYGDIKEFRYLRTEIDHLPKRTRYIKPSRVVIIGDDFEVEIFAHKSLINQIKEIKG